MKNRSELFASGFFPDEEFLPYSSDYNILYNIRSQDIYFAVRYQSQPPIRSLFIDQSDKQVFILMKLVYR